MNAAHFYCSRCGREMHPDANEEGVMAGWIPCACGAKTPAEDDVRLEDLPAKVEWGRLKRAAARSSAPTPTKLIDTSGRVPSAAKLKWTGVSSLRFTFPCDREGCWGEVKGEVITDRPADGVVRLSGVPCSECDTTYAVEIAENGKTEKT